MVQEKSIEIRMRNTLKRRGYILKKSRLKDPQAILYGVYWILNNRGVVVYGDRNTGLSLEEVVEWVENMGKGE